MNPHSRHRPLAPQASASAYSATRTSVAVHIGWLRLANLRHCWRTVHRRPRGAPRDLANPGPRWIHAPEVRGRSGVLALWHPRPSAFWPCGPQGRIVLALWRTRPERFWSCGTQGHFYWPCGTQGQNGFVPGCHKARISPAYERPRPVMQPSSRRWPSPLVEMSLPSWPQARNPKPQARSPGAGTPEPEPGTPESGSPNSEPGNLGTRARKPGAGTPNSEARSPEPGNPQVRTRKPEATPDRPPQKDHPGEPKPKPTVMARR